MKNIYIITILFALLLTSTSLFVGCVSDKESGNQVDTPITEPIPVPESFSNDTALSNHLRDLSENLNTFSVIINNIADGIDGIGIKDINNPSVGERLKLMQVVLPKIQPVMTLIKELQVLDNKSQSIKDTLSEERMKAFEDFELLYQTRFDSLNTRFEKYMTQSQ